MYFNLLFFLFFFHSNYVHCRYSYCIRKKVHFFVVVFNTYVTGFDALFSEKETMMIDDVTGVPFLNQ